MERNKIEQKTKKSEDPGKRKQRNEKKEEGKENEEEDEKENEEEGKGIYGTKKNKKDDRKKVR